VIYAEAEQALARLGEWKMIRHRQAGQVHYHLFDTEQTT